MGKHMRPTFSAFLGALFFLSGLNALAVDQQQECQQAKVEKKHKEKSESSESSSDSSSDSKDDSSSSSISEGDCNHKTFGKLFLTAGRAFTMSAGAFFEWSMGATVIVNSNKHIQKLHRKKHEFCQKIQARKQRHYGELAYCNFEGRDFGPDDEVFNQQHQVRFHKAYLPNTRFHDRDLSNISFRRAYVGYDASFSNVTFTARTFRGTRYIDHTSHWHRLNKYQAKRLYKQFQGRIEGQQTMQGMIEQMQQQAPVAVDAPQAANAVADTTSSDKQE